MSANPSKVAIVTGASRGIGAAVAERLARDGFTVVINYAGDAASAESLARKIEAAGGRALTAQADVADPAAVRRMFDAAETAFGGVDVVVNNAGVAQMGGIAETSLEDWRWAVDINLLGVVRGCKVFAPLLAAQGGGQLVNIASMAGLVHMPHAAAYNATKAAVVALSETLQLELEPDGIRVSVVCPAFFRTDLARNMRAANPALEGMTRRLVERARIGADEIAERIFSGIQRGDFHILTHPEARRFWWIKRLLPHRLFLGLMRRQLAKVDARMWRKAAVSS